MVNSTFSTALLTYRRIQGVEVSIDADKGRMGELCNGCSGGLYESGEPFEIQSHITPHLFFCVEEAVN